MADEANAAAQLVRDDAYVGLPFEVDLAEADTCTVEKVIALLHVAGSGPSANPPRTRGDKVGHARRFRRRPGPARAEPGTTCGSAATWRSTGPDHAVAGRAPARLPPAADRVPALASTSTSASRPGACTARPTAGTSSGTRCSCLPFLNLRLPRRRSGDAALPVAAAPPGPSGRAAGRPPRCDVPLAERCHRARGDHRRCTSTRGRGAGCRTTPTCSGTSAWRSPTTPGGTTRRPATSTSSPRTARS